MHGRTPEPMMGVVRMLQEGARQFDVLDSASDFAPYKTLILPDVIPVNAALKTKLQQYLRNGGSLVASYQSGLDGDMKDFALPELGVTMVGEAPYSPDFIVAKGPLAKDLPDTELVMYLKGLQVKPRSGAAVLLDTDVPYFNREWNHFSSHRHTPSSGKVGYPGAVRNGNCIYFMHPVFTQYNKNAARWCKQIVLNALNLLNPNPLVQHSGPSTVIALLNDQAAQKRSVLHLLHYIPERRGTDFDSIEDVIPLYNVNVSVLPARGVSKVTLVPQNENVTFTRKNGRIEMVLKELNGHQMIAFS
jgi:hypothetical protein